MKYLIIADNHLVEKSSVIAGRGERYSDRLENQIATFKWVSSFNLPVIHLGDFFDRNFIKSEEQMALDEIKPYLKDTLFLLGNHEYAGGYDLLGALGGDFIREPMEMKLGSGPNTRSVLFLPFNSKEEDIKGDYDIIFGHIGIEGIPFGAKGFDIEVIKKHCKVFLNGHLHNRYRFTDTMWNIGSLTAQNFSDNCLEYRKGAVILDTEDLSLEFVENPYAFNFYKFTWDDYKSKYSKNLDLNKAIKDKNSCISISCKVGVKKEILESEIFKDVYYLRISEELVKSNKKNDKEDGPNVILNPEEKFRTSFIDKFGETKLVNEELGEIFR